MDVGEFETMKRFLAALAFLFICSPAFADNCKVISGASWQLGSTQPIPCNTAGAVITSSGGGGGGTSSNFSAAFPATGTAAGFNNSSSGNMVPATVDNSTGGINVNVVGGGGSGGTSSNFGAAFPATGTASGMKSGSNMVNMTSTNGTALDVNCTVGCVAGTFNNNANGVATSSTNGQAAAWIYVFNGTTFDRWPGDATNGGKVNITNASLPLPTGASTATNQTATQAPVAPAAASATKSDLVGGQYNVTNPTFTDGQQGSLQVGLRGALNTTLFTPDSNVPITVMGTATDGVSTSGTGARFQVGAFQYLFNGSTFDRQQSVVNGTNTIGTGIAAAGMLGQCDDTSPTAITENQFGNVRLGCSDRSQLAGALSAGNVTGLIQASASAAISMNTATTTQIIALSGSTKIYVTSYDVISAGTANVTFVYGTGSNCGTGQTALTGAYPLTAQAGIAKGSGLGPVLVVPAGNALCVTDSAAVQISGSVAYTQF
jgi:hypothetical protein